MYFQSKRDGWLGWIFWIVISLPPVLLIKEGHYFYVLYCLPIALFLGWIWFRTGYTVTENDLEIKSGLIYMKIPLKEIKTIRKSRNPFSAPALSLDRLEIKYGDYRKVIISPEDKKGFIRAIKKRNQDVDISHTMLEV